MATAKRAAIYARVSTELQEREGTSLDSQVARCRVFAEDQGWLIEHVVQEQGSGGDIDRRPKLQNLLVLAKAGQFDVLVCYHIDRLSRDVDDQGWLKRELRTSGVEVALVTGHQDPIIQAVEGAMGQQERKQMRERIKRGKEQTAKNGKYLPGGTPPFGYRHRRAMVGRIEKVVGVDEDPVTAPIVQEMFNFVARGGTATGCAEWLNARGISSPRGGRWRHPSVCVILQNPLYKGRPCALRYEVVRDEFTKKSENGFRPPGQWVALPPETAPALVSSDLWQRANDQLAAGRTGARRNNPEPETYLLRAGYIKCGYCGGVMSASRRKGEPTYLCTQRATRGCRESGAILAGEIDGVVWHMVTSVLKDPGWIRQQLEEQARNPSLAEHISIKKIDLRRLQKEEARLAETLGKLDDPEPVLARLRMVSVSRKAVETELNDLTVQQHHLEQIAQRVNDLDQRFLDAWKRVDSMSYEERRSILRQFAVQVTLWKRDHDPRCVIDWAFEIGDDWWQGDPYHEDDMSWVQWTTESSSPSKVDFADSTLARR